MTWLLTVWIASTPPEERITYPFTSYKECASMGRQMSKDWWEEKGSAMYWECTAVKES